MREISYIVHTIKSIRKDGQYDSFIIQIQMKPLVSVYCYAYNHEKYIKDALDGFVKQKTSFPFKVIVHDDASTDGTAKIIRAYAERFPDIIRPIFQTVNQYSQGISIFKNYILPELEGKYYAICEGDDYWIDENKLQLQVDWLEKHPEYSFCVHNTKCVNCKNGEEYLINKDNNDRDMSTEEIIQWKAGLFQTSSFMYRAEFAIVPSAFSIKGIGDFPLSVYLATCGKVRYLGRVMSVYRYLAAGSWTMKINYTADSVNKKIKHWQNRINMLKNVDQYTEKKYSNVIYDTIRRYEFNILYEQNDLKTIRKKYADKYKSLTIKRRFYIFVNCYCPGIIKLYHIFRRQ